MWVSLTRVGRRETILSPGINLESCWGGLSIVSNRLGLSDRFSVLGARVDDGCNAGDLARPPLSDDDPVIFGPAPFGVGRSDGPRCDGSSAIPAGGGEWGDRGGSGGDRGDNERGGSGGEWGSYLGDRGGNGGECGDLSRYGAPSCAGRRSFPLVGMGGGYTPRTSSPWEGCPGGGGGRCIPFEGAPP